MIYKVSEKFKSLQGEGLYAGTPMAFIRFVGCSVGKKVCVGCDTDFERVHSFRGGGEFTAEELVAWAGDYEHICLTGGEPLDYDLTPLVVAGGEDFIYHIETSGTRLPWEKAFPHEFFHQQAQQRVRKALYICVSPKPGYLEDAMLDYADEIKVIVPGLSNEIPSAQVDARIRLIKGEGYHCAPGEFEAWARGYRWPDLTDALRWAQTGKLVFLQPRNGKFDIDPVNLRYVTDLLQTHPTLRLSVQMHKILKVQ